MAIEITDLNPELPPTAVTPPPLGNKAETLGLRASVATANPQGRWAGNERRSSGALKFFLLALLLMIAGFAAFAGMLSSFYHQEVLPRLTPVTHGSTSQELAENRAMTALSAALAEANRNFDKASGQILRLQKQVDELRSDQMASEGRLKSLAEKLIQAAGDSTTQSVASSNVAAAIQIASVIPAQSAVGKELWLLKERNRLTFYADQAIAEGSSEAMANLWTSLRDPELEPVRHGAQAEIIRVQKAYAAESRLPADYRLPVRDLFPGSDLRQEAELDPAALIDLLKDDKRHVLVRARAAYVLGGHPVPEVAKALIEAMKNDSSLDVCREAHQTLQRCFGMSTPLFHVAAAESWWQTQATK